MSRLTSSASRAWLLGTGDNPILPQGGRVGEITPEIRPAQLQLKWWHWATQVIGRASVCKFRSPKSPLLSLKDQVSPYCKCTSSRFLCALHGASTEPREVKGGSCPPVLPCPLPLSAISSKEDSHRKSSPRKTSAIKRVTEPTKKMLINVIDKGCSQAYSCTTALSGMTPNTRAGPPRNP